MKKLDWKRTAVLGFGFFGISIMWSVYNSFVPPMLRDYSLPWWLVGFVMVFDNILGITLLPFIGQLSDGVRTRWGRRIPFIMIGAPVAAIFMILIPIVHNAMPLNSMGLWLMTSVIIVMNVSMAIFRTPTVTLMPDITPPELRSKANGIINLMGGLGTVIAFLVGGTLFGYNTVYPFLLAAIVMLIAEAIVIFFVKEPEEFRTTEASAKAERPGFGKSFMETLRNVGGLFTAEDKSALFICLAIFFWFTGYNALETFWTSYTSEVLYAPQVAAGLMTADEAVGKGSTMLTYMAMSFLVFAVPAGLIGTRIGRKRTIVTGLAVMGTLWLAVWFISNPTFITVMLVLSGLAWACVNINSLPVVADLAPPEKLGAYTGLYYFFSMLAASTSPVFVGWLFDLSDNLVVMFLFASIAIFIALGFTLAVRHTEPPKAADLGEALEMVADADM